MTEKEKLIKKAVEKHKRRDFRKASLFMFFFMGVAMIFMMGSQMSYHPAGGKFFSTIYWFGR
jgi:hypothetical protein